MTIKILNLYAGIGGNRKLWPNEQIEVTAVENNPEIAKIYSDFFPNDKVIIADAHQFLLEHYKEYDFIWSSPPCPTHSRMRLLNMEQNSKAVFPDMKLYEEILFLQHFCDCKWVVENVISYYEPLIKPYTSNNHYFWSNFSILKTQNETRNIRGQHKDELIENADFDLSNYGITQTLKLKVLRNCVVSKLGLHVFNMAFKDKQQMLNELGVGRK